MKNHISNLLFSRYHIKKLLPIHSSCLDPFQTYYRMVHILVWTYFTEFWLVRDSSAVWRLFSTCCSHGKSESSTYAEQRICPPTLGQHISTFRGYLILFSIRNLYINRFTNHLTLRKWCYTALQHDFPLDPMISSFHIHFGTFATWLRENYDYRNVSWEMICI